MYAKLMEIDGKVCLAVSPKTPMESMKLMELLPRIRTVEKKGKVIQEGEGLYNDNPESFYIIVDVDKEAKE